MFSSDPVSGHGATFSSDAFIADLFVVDAGTPGARPTILAADEAAALLRANASGSAWLPDSISEFDAPEFDDLSGGSASAHMSQLSPRDAQLEALRAQAREEAEAMLHQALAEREAEEGMIREQLQADAYAAGIEAGRAESEGAAQEALTTALQALWLTNEEMRATEARWLVALEDNIAALVAGAARHIVGREVAADDTLVRQLAARAVAEYPQDHPLHIRVNPADLATLKAAFALAPRVGEMRWTADARVDRGGVLLEGRERIVDGRVDTALERIYRTLSGQYA